MRGFIVAQVEQDAWPVPVPIGVVREDGLIDFIVKLTFSFGDEQHAVAKLVEGDGQLRHQRINEHVRAAPGELLYASDFQAAKAYADVSIVGNAYSQVATKHIVASVRVGDIERSFAAVTGTDVLEIPIVRATLVGEFGERDVAPVGPREPLSESEELDELVELRGPHLPANALVELEGLTKKHMRTVVSLPAIEPRVLLKLRHWETLELPLACDTLWLDTAAQEIVTLWRGTYEPTRRHARELQLLVLALGREEDGPTDWDEALEKLATSRFYYAEEAEPHAFSNDRLESARYAAAAQGGDSKLSVEDYAAVSAELAEGREERKDILHNHGLDEPRWLVEERSWLVRMGNEAGDGRVQLAIAFGEAFVAHQDALGKDEPTVELETYAALRVEIERAPEPAKVLGELDKTLAWWMRQQRRWDRDSVADKELGARVRALLNSKRAELDAHHEPS